MLEGRMDALARLTVMVDRFRKEHVDYANERNESQSRPGVGIHLTDIVREVGADPTLLTGLHYMDLLLVAQILATLAGAAIPNDRAHGGRD
jgi:hypothetical protein